MARAHGFCRVSETYAKVLKNALLSNSDLFSQKIRAIVDLFAYTKQNGICGFNSFKLKGSGLLNEASRVVYTEAYEEFLSDVGRAKYDEFEKKILVFADFKNYWALIKLLYPTKTNCKGKLRRKLLCERGWAQDGGVSFADGISEFQAVFELFLLEILLIDNKGDKLLEHIANAIGHPNMDFRTERKLIKKGK